MEARRTFQGSKSYRQLWIILAALMAAAVLGLGGAFVASGALSSAPQIVRTPAAPGTVLIHDNHRSRRVPATANTLWSIASITKPVTAAAFMACVARGLLSLDASIPAVLPEFARDGDKRPWRRDVTPRHLLTHTSGLAGFSRDNLAMRKRHAPVDDFIASFVDEDVHFQPGRWHLYSSVGLGLIAECVGRSAGGAKGRAMDAYWTFALALLRDLGVNDAVFLPDEDQQQRIAWVEPTGQEGLDWEIGNSKYFRSLVFPWGGHYFRARDVVTFVTAF